MKRLILIFLLFLNISLFAQYSGSGEIINYNTSSSGCGEPACHVQTNPEDIYSFVVPADGAVTFTATLMTTTLICCGIPWDYNHSVGLFNYSLGVFVGSGWHTGPGIFTDGSTCVQEGDTVKLLFQGLGGTYNFTLDFTPDPICDSGDNNSISVATPVPIVTDTTTGCLRFWQSGGPILDNIDYFALDSFKVGDSVSFHFDQDARIVYSLYRSGDPNAIVSWDVNTIASVEHHFVSQWDDEYFLSATGFWPAGCVYYSFRLEFNTPVPCDAEINDTQVEATDLSDMYDPFTGCLRYPYSGDNIDWFRLDSLNYGDSITLYLDNTTRVVYQLYRQGWASALKTWDLTNTSTTGYFVAPWNDRYYIRTSGVWPNGPGEYSVDIDQNASLSCDPEPNDDKSSAYIPNDLGQTIRGCVDFLGNEDNTDFINIGYYDTGDTLDMLLEISNWATFYIHRQNLAGFISSVFVGSGQQLNYQFIVPASDEYFIEVNNADHNQNKTYAITLDACPDHLTIKNTAIAGNRSAEQSITLINCHVEEDAVISAPEVLVSPLFDSPQGELFEINNDGCN